MTTVAFDGRFFVADGRSTTGGLITGTRAKKIYLIDAIIGGEETQVIFAGAGRYERITSVKRWLESGGDPFDMSEEAAVPKVNENEFEGLLLTREGALYCLEDGLIPMECEYPTNLGSGGPLAQAAMIAGKNAIEAVQVACEIDTGSGGELTVFDTEAWAFLVPSED